MLQNINTIQKGINWRHIGLGLGLLLGLVLAPGSTIGLELALGSTLGLKLGNW